ncbi:hypothetical protein BC936DRAFT_137378 [Jimgerdemannia flammicorona]|uniref:Uncharacterized protein n=1 Tax=Jimgerdemannia flammicorona TaxID=994334 RepID=A0A433DJ22_9FUNG|nr:hypothetical protein BC936DRAFT_137378 [Jimgerdemannia flammicorona]
MVERKRVEYTVADRWGRWGKEEKPSSSVSDTSGDEEDCVSDRDVAGVVECEGICEFFDDGLGDSEPSRVGESREERVRRMWCGLEGCKL